MEIQPLEKLTNGKGNRIISCIECSGTYFSFITRLSANNMERLIIGSEEPFMTHDNDGLDKRISVWEKLWKKYGYPKSRQFYETDESWKNPMLYDKTIVSEDSERKTEL